MRARVEKLLEAGWSRRAIAAELGIDPSTVTRHARALGYPDVVRRRSPFDWSAIREYYDAGHTIEQCRARFGFSYGAWDKAVMRGDLVPRARSDRQLSHLTRDRVEQLIGRGFTQVEVAKELGLSKSTVNYHCRRLGLRADPRFARRYDWAEVQRAIDDEGLSMRQCRERFGFCAESWAAAVRRRDIVPRPHVTPIEELLVSGRRRQRSHLKSRLVKEGLKSNRCEICGSDEWLGKPPLSGAASRERRRERQSPGEPDAPLRQLPQPDGQLGRPRDRRG
jgi:DNA-binding CsgD family transcriptional regulator